MSTKERQHQPKKLAAWLNIVHAIHVAKDAAEILRQER